MGEEEKVKAEAKEEKKERENNIVEERIYTVPLGRAWITPVTKRTPRAMRLLKAFIKRHMKVNDDSIIISNDVNEKIWDRGIGNPPRKIRVRVTKDKDGLVTVHLAEGE